jgi:hypothetical protein
MSFHPVTVTPGSCDSNSNIAGWLRFVLWHDAPARQSSRLMGKQNAAITSTMTKNQVTRSSQSMMGP